MNESQLAQDVRATLDEATAGLRVPDGVAARARSRGRRRRAGRWMIAAVPAVAVIAGAAVISHGGSTPARGASASARPSGTVQAGTAQTGTGQTGTGQTGTGQTGTGQTGTGQTGTGQTGTAQTDAYVARHIEAVLGTADNYLIETSATSGPGQVTTTYLDPVTGTTRSVVSGAGDKVTYWIQTSVSGNEDQWRTTYVDATNHTWWTKASHSGPLGDDTSNTLVLSAESLPTQISQALAQGELRIGQKSTVSGHAAIELVYAGDLAAKAGAVRYWVDAATYEPIQIDLPPFTAASTISESWLPKTPATVAQTDKPQVPAGFRQVPPSGAFN